MEFFSITSLHVCLISVDNSQLICQAIINDYLKYQIRSVYSLAYLIQCILEAILKRSSITDRTFDRVFQEKARKKRKRQR